MTNLRKVLEFHRAMGLPVGNWCWDAVAMGARQLARLIATLRREGFALNGAAFPEHFNEWERAIDAGDEGRIFRAARLAQRMFTLARNEVARA